MTRRNPHPTSAWLAAGLTGLLHLAPAQAAPPTLSQASQGSLLPLALVVSAPALLLASVAQLTVVAVQASADGTGWVLQRASDGAQVSMHLAGQASTTMGASVQVTALATGWLLISAGQALAFVPNAVGKALLHHERVAL